MYNMSDFIIFTQVELAHLCILSRHCLIGLGLLLRIQLKQLKSIMTCHPSSFIVARNVIAHMSNYK